MNINNEYIYYVEVSYQLDGVNKTFRFDYDHRELIIDNFGDGGEEFASQIVFTYTYHLPTVFDVVNTENTTTYTMEEGIQAVYTNVSYDDNDNKTNYRINAKLNYYALSGHSLSAKYVCGTTSYMWEDAEVSYNSATDTYYFEVSASLVASYNYIIRGRFVLVENTYETTTLTYDVSNIANFNEDKFDLITNNESIKTLNSDGTINIYRDLEFTYDPNDFDYDIVYEIGYGKVLGSDAEAPDYLSFASLDVIRSTDRFIVLENMENATYAIRYVHIITEVDGIDYILYTYGYNFIEDNGNARILANKNEPVYGEYDDNNTDGYYIYAKSSYILPVNNEASVTVYYGDDPYTLDSSNNFGSGDTVLIETINDDPITITYSFTEAMLISKGLAEVIFNESYDDDYITITSEAMFNQIKEYYLTNYSITIQGTYFAERSNISLSLVDND